VSIIVPARNESATIANLARSILATTYHPFELLVVDDRSSDDTAAIIGCLADPRLRLIRGEELLRDGTESRGPAIKATGLRREIFFSLPMPIPSTLPSCWGTRWAP